MSSFHQQQIPSFYNSMQYNFTLTPPIITPPSIEEYERMIKERNDKNMMISTSPYKSIILNHQLCGQVKTQKKFQRIGSIIDSDVVEGKEKFSIPKEWIPYLEHYKTSVAFVSSDEFEKIGVNDSNIDSILRLMRLWDESKLPLKPEEEAQWVSKALDASSEYSTSWSPSNLVGPSNVYPRYGDFTFAWAPMSQNGTTEFIIIEFEHYYRISGIQIFETYHPGAIVKISCLPRGKDKYCQNYQEEEEDTIIGSTTFEANANDWITIYQGSAQQRKIPMNSRIFTPLIQPTNFESKIIRLDMDTTDSNSWSEIDAVKLIGIPSTGNGH